MSLANYNVWSCFSRLFGPTVASTAAVETRWLLLSKSYVVGVFNTYSQAVAYKNTMPLEHMDFDTTILPITFKKPDASAVNSMWLPEHRKICCREIKQMLLNIGLIKKWGKIGHIDLMFLYMMLNPELLAQHPRFYETVEAKIAELKKVLAEEKNLPRSNILERITGFLQDIKKRSDYRPLVPVVPVSAPAPQARHCHCWSCKPQSQPEQNRYNFRKRKSINYSE